ncbi:hypothetical protein CHARACLAT_017721 [Characodon lateralis]|uniref:Uncharacterized protein n=1 Tax=Characodon lateralis TaxID=208331 RepID=A0ABU7DTF5_9TELE|nr:hypothetical protein [Characodon lateralis]
MSNDPLSLRRVLTPKQRIKPSLGAADLLQARRGRSPICLPSFSQISPFTLPILPQIFPPAQKGGEKKIRSSLSGLPALVSFQPLVLVLREAQDRVLDEEEPGTLNPARSGISLSTASAAASGGGRRRQRSREDLQSDCAAPSSAVVDSGGPEGKRKLGGNLSPAVMRTNPEWISLVCCQKHLERITQGSTPPPEDQNIIHISDILACQLCGCC